MEKSAVRNPRQCRGAPSPQPSHRSSRSQTGSATSRSKTTARRGMARHGVRRLKRARDMGPHQTFRKAASMPIASTTPEVSPMTSEASPPEPVRRAAAMIGNGDPREVLTRSEFLTLLRREQRRADRSRAPLSVVLYRDAGGRLSQPQGGQLLIDTMHGLKRETDTVGRLGDNLIALLCPDTGAEGARSLMRKIADRAQECNWLALTITYPDELFDKLENGVAHALDFAVVPPNDSAGPPDAGYSLKRALDIVGALVALVLFSPILIAAAIAISLTSPGPVIFKQIRLGKGGVPFVFYKFRSMASEVDDAIHRRFVADLIGASGRGDAAVALNGSLYKLEADPRVTPIGRVIRRTSIDEFPQLFNVLKGDMSLVGPRPPLRYEAEKYQSWHLRRIIGVKPGITGLWQVEGRSRVSFNDMVRLDLRYIRSCSLWLDLKILLKTVKAVLRCDGAT